MLFSFLEKTSYFFFEKETSLILKGIVRITSKRVIVVIVEILIEIKNPDTWIVKCYSLPSKISFFLVLFFFVYI